MHVSHNVIGRESLRIIASDKVPHNNSELMFETMVLRWAHPAMRWSEEVRVNKVVAFLAFANFILRTFAIQFRRRAPFRTCTYTQVVSKRYAEDI